MTGDVVGSEKASFVDRAILRRALAVEDDGDEKREESQFIEEEDVEGLSALKGYDGCV